MRTTDTHVYFWKGWLSNFKTCDIHYEGVNYHCSEQLYMTLKAGYFKDYVAYENIINCKTAREAKDFGRQVKNFDAQDWNTRSFEAMLIACYCKFSQNSTLKQKLLATGDKILVEASPMDLIWGVGFHEDDDLVLDENNWRGENRLGKVLMMVREVLK